MTNCPRITVIFTLSLLMLVTACGRVPGKGDSYAEKGMRLLTAEDYSEAVKHLEMAIQLGVSQYKTELVYTCLGNAYNKMDKFEKAIEMHKKALEKNPDFYKAWVNLGIVHRLTGDFDQAEQCYLKAMNLEPDYAELHASLGALNIFQGKYQEAVKQLERAVELDEKLPVAWSNLALAYATIGQFKKAQSALKKAVVLGNKNGAIIQQRINNLKALAQEKEQYPSEVE
jgi:tetratricopeptide (TPR) repeat protein